MALSEHLEKLRYFQRLTMYRSIREGALAMGISQAGLSKSIASLETVLEVPLFLRSREGLTLTKEGQEVLKTSEQILKDAASLETRLRSLTKSKSPSKFRIGMYDSIAVYFYSELKSYLTAIYENIKFEMTVDMSLALAKGVQQNELDIAIGVNLDRQAKSGIDFVRLFDDHYSFYVSNRHDIEANDLPLLINSRAEDRDGIKLEEHLKYVMKQHSVHRVFNFETIKTLTSQGIGIGVLPTQVAKPLLQNGALVSLQMPKTKHLFGIHNIGFLVARDFIKVHRDFAEDIFRLGDRWSKN